MSDVRKIVENTLVPHSAFNEASSRLEQCFKYADSALEPICVAVVGESRTGKSRALEECYAAHLHIRQQEGLTVPIIRVKTPSKPTVKSLAELMLRAMKDPRFDAGTENAKTIRLQVLMKSSGVRMVMIDEFQHFYDKGSHKVMHHVADWLKILVDDSRVALVVAGLPSCTAVLDQNEQLSGRFLSPILMPRFDWENVDQRDEFLGILGAFQASIGSVFDMPSLDSSEMAFRCYAGTGGLIGYLSKFLRQAVWNAIDNNRKSISIEELATAHLESVWQKDGVSGIANPFSRNFCPLPSANLLDKIAQVGTPKEHTSPLIARRRRTPTDKVSQILSAS
jgi:hypothetical protein